MMPLAVKSESASEDSQGGGAVNSFDELDMTSSCLAMAVQVAVQVRLAPDSAQRRTTESSSLGMCTMRRLRVRMMRRNGHHFRRHYARDED